MATKNPLPAVGGIVLCGGQSSRMGFPKALLPFGDETMLFRIVRILKDVVEPIVVVAAPEQNISPLPPDIVLARDLRAQRGPLEGLFAGLSAMAPHAQAAFVTSCDVPLLVPAFVARLIARLENFEIAVPFDGQFHHPLSAVYRTTVIDRIQSLLDANRLRPAYLFDLASTNRLATIELLDVDPDLGSLRNLNYPHDYVAALASMGLVPPRDILARL